MQKQVDKTHYDFQKYLSKSRWNSIWHQLHEVQKVSPESVLEVGPGPNIFKLIAAQIGIKVETIDIDPELNPDYVGSVTDMPFECGKYDLVCAFQVLEHMPYEESLNAFREMVRVSRKHVIISLPDAKPRYRIFLDVPKFGYKQFFFESPRSRMPVHHFDGQHYWEVNKKGYELDKVIADFSAMISLERTYRVNENKYHRFFVFKK